MIKPTYNDIRLKWLDIEKYSLDVAEQLDSQNRFNYKISDIKGVSKLSHLSTQLSDIQAGLFYLIMVGSTPNTSASQRDQQLSFSILNLNQTNSSTIIFISYKRKKALVFRLGLSRNLVPEVGLEPTLLSETDFESVVYTNFTTRASAANYTQAEQRRKPLIHYFRSTVSFFTTLL